MALYQPQPKKKVMGIVNPSAGGLTPTAPQVPSVPTPMPPSPLMGRTVGRVPPPTPNDRPQTPPPLYAPGELLPGNPPPNPKPDPRNGPPGDPNDPGGGRGTVKPPPPLSRAAINRIRQNETPKERLARLRGMRRAGNRSANLDDRIVGLKNRVGVLPDVPFKDQPSRQKVQLDDKPETWNSEAMAELPPPIGVTPQFYDNPEGDKQVKTAQKQKEQLRSDVAAEREAVSQNDKDKNLDTRSKENLAQRLARLKAELKTAKPGRRAQLEKRIKALEARIKAGDTKGPNKKQPGTPQRPFRNRGVEYSPLSYGGQLRV